MPKSLVVDLESQKLFSDVGSRDRTDLLGVGCACVYDYEANRCRTYDHNDLDELRRSLESADEIVWFCGDRFDGPVLYGLANSQLPRQLVGKTRDLYRIICLAAGRNPNLGNRGFGLGAICEATFGRGKTGDGKEAPEMWRQGKWGKLLNYCLDDVQLCRDLNDHMLREGYVIGPRGLRIEVPCQSQRPLPQSAGRSAGLL